MNDDYTINSHCTSPIHFSLKGWENVRFELTGVKGLSSLYIFSRQVRRPRFRARRRLHRGSGCPSSSQVPAKTTSDTAGDHGTGDHGSWGPVPLSASGNEGNIHDRNLRRPLGNDPVPGVVEPEGVSAEDARLDGFDAAGRSHGEARHTQRGDRHQH